MRACSLLLVFAALAACGEAPTPASVAPATAPPTRADQSAATLGSQSEGQWAARGTSAESPDETGAKRAPDFVVELRQQDEFIIVLINGDARGAIDDDDTWRAIERILARFVSDDAEHRNPSVSLKTAHAIDTKWIVRAVNQLIEIGIENVEFNGLAPVRDADSGGR